jgi:Zn-dependent metalloprotease
MKKRSVIILLLLVVGLLLPASAGAEGLAATSGQSLSAGEGYKIYIALTASAGADNPDSEVRISITPGTGVASFLPLTGAQAASIRAQAGPGLEGQARLFFEQFGALFGVKNAASELQPVGRITDALGGTHLSYQQVYRGVQVFAGILRVHFDGQGLITSANGTFIPDIALNPLASLSASQAASIAQAALGRTDLIVSSSRLNVYRENLARGLPGANHLVYQVEVGDGIQVGEQVFVDAHSGAVVERISTVQDALERQVYNQEFNPKMLLWAEGDPYPFSSEALTETVVADVNNLIEYAADVYQMMANATGGEYLSYNGRDATMISVVDVQIPDFCPNAQWTGHYTRFCQGLAVDDIVAHEWGHAYTKYTDGLVYMWQPGAINESYSDIYGEVVDLINESGMDEPGGLRSDGICSVYTPRTIYLEVQAPESIAGDYQAGYADFGPRVDGTITGSLTMVDDGSGDTSLEGCGPLINDLTGKIAFIRRGTCTFVEKVKNAQDAGAIGALIANHQTGGDALLIMAGDDPSVTIQSMFIGYSDGNAIQAELEAGVDVEVRFAQEERIAEDDSVRWLMGEDIMSLGGPWRDMWNPECNANPGKVSSEVYFCSTEDAGGVHYNSGVPNHAFALLVDGGVYNGQSITGLGLNRAFQIYWRAQNLYLVPTSRFPDLGDALQASCKDLVGFEVPDLLTGMPAGEQITRRDCQEVGKVVAAVEFYLEPVCWEGTMSTHRQGAQGAKK